MNKNLYIYSNLNITEMLFFVAKKNTNKNTYEIINECIKLEGINEDIETIFLNLKKINFRRKKKNNKKEFEIAELKKNNCGELKAKDFKIKNHISIINKSKHICQLISSDIKIKILVKIDMKIKTKKLNFQG